MIDCNVKLDDHSTVQRLKLKRLLDLSISCSSKNVICNYFDN